MLTMNQPGDSPSDHNDGSSIDQAATSKKRVSSVSYASSPAQLACTPTRPDASRAKLDGSPLQYAGAPEQGDIAVPVPSPHKRRRKAFQNRNTNDEDLGPQLFDRAKAIRLCQESFFCTPKEAHLEVMECIAEKTGLSSGSSLPSGKDSLIRSSYDVLARPSYYHRVASGSFDELSRADTGHGQHIILCCQWRLLCLD